MSALTETLQQKAETGIQAKEPIQTIGEYLSQRRGDIERALPKHMNPDRLLRVTMTLIEQTPKLLQCSTASLVGGVLQAAQLGLEPGLLGECYLVPYWNTKKQTFEAQFQVGYRGFAKLALQSGGYSTFEAHVVYERDGFDYALGSGKFLRHKPFLGADRGEPIAAYAIVETKDGKAQFEIMPLADIQKVRAASKASDDGPWVTWWEEMARKTPAKRLSKYLQLSPQLSRAVAADETTKTEIAEDMSNVIDATDWKVVDAPTAQQQSAHAPQETSGRPQAGDHQPEAPASSGRPSTGDRQFEHTANPPRAGSKAMSEKQQRLLHAKAKAAMGDQYKVLLPAWLKTKGLPENADTLASNQASWVIDELAQTSAPTASDAPPQSSSDEEFFRGSSSPGDGMFGSDEPVPF